ncbi:plastocyanin/azurin family copper-binding protein [Paenibacillus sp. GD4]|uniref:plastocyanin/azurin family copper-binding protein n=1 Tax=Paenibacillus sp. GD4 TaxID=3068890 RepID=UPI0027967458|nr:plastocyanin/azurin family copper-binding protein [Paenibacillus sp. GD4]MDQ1914562.1 plastocyanin/azurin family copper-binding protein [Paenibacillus sp. GD4]
MKLFAKSFITLLLWTLFILLAASVTASAADQAEVKTDAQIMAELGILQGDEGGLSADYFNKETTRIQAAIMFLRLKGLEQEALSYKGSDNFSDAGLVWAGGQPILAYLKANPGLGWGGIGNNKFDPLAGITAQQYYKVMVEALGYKQDSDFEYAQVLPFAASIGLGKAADAAHFKNVHIATATVETLNCKIKGMGKTLAEVLVELKIIAGEKTKALSYTKLEFSAQELTGRYLVDGNGRTLYYFSKDASDLNACTGKCLELWPVFYSDTLKVPAELNAADFGELTRPDGTKQTTYNGWPLYYYAKDEKAGDINGEAFNNVWFVINAPAFAALGSKADIGLFLTDSNGLTLYYFDKDTPGVSNCSGQCLVNWPAYYEESLQAPTGVKESDFGVYIRPDGTKQTTYKGYPLYYFVKDLKRGDTAGHGLNNIWYVVDPAKFNGTKAANFGVKTAKSDALGTYLVDSNGLALYLFTKDAADLNACKGQCLKNWSLFDDSNLTVAPELNAADFGEITREDGTKQTTYKGWPLYYFINDMYPGQTLGENVNQVWFVLHPETTAPLEKPKGKTYTIEISGFKFSQEELTIEAGSTVTFTNLDSVKHNAVSVDGSFHTDLIAKGESANVTFDKPGVYEYFCEPHKSRMKGKIIVK